MNLKSLKNKYNLSDLEVFTQDISTHKVSFVANKLKQAESIHKSGLALRLIQNKKIGFVAHYQHKSSYNPDEMIRQAIDLSQFSQEIEIELPSNLQKNEIKENKVNGNTLSLFKEEGEKIIENAISSVEAFHGTPLLDVSFDLDEIQENLENSRDVNYLNSHKMFSFFISLRETKENDFIEIYTGGIAETLSQISLQDSIKEIVDFYILSRKPAKIKNGSYPLLFTSKASKELFNIIELALNGKQVNEKSSPWHDKLQTKVLNKLITLRQEPSFGYMARAIDDEGNIIKPLTLINNGVLENFYFDLVSAWRRGPGTSPSGNGFKSSLSSQPAPVLLNMVVSCGKRSRKEIIKDIDYGLLVDQTIGGFTTNISGDYSINVDVGFLIEKGEIVGRVKDTMVSGNIYNVLNNVIELSNNPQWHWSNIYSSDVLLEGFTVTTK